MKGRELSVNVIVEWERGGDEEEEIDTGDD